MGAWTAASWIHDTYRPKYLCGRRSDPPSGFVLTMGIGVDSNVLIFERIKEEIAAGHGVRASLNAGFGCVFWTLVDTHVAALISAAFLFNFGTGPIRGFAVTLALGLASNLFTSIFVSKTLFELALSRRRQAATLSIYSVFAVGVARGLQPSRRHRRER
jgi:hypothetical protein